MKNTKLTVRYNYYWYHHMAIDYKMMDKINKAIMNHDWEAFKDYKKKYGRRCLFPNMIYPCVEMEDEEVENIYPDVLPLNKKNFNLITHSECECG